MADIPKWQLNGDWFDVCKCNISLSLRIRPGADIRKLRWHPRLACPQGKLR